jgi:arginine decarboxylase-like protein
MITQVMKNKVRYIEHHFGHDYFTIEQLGSVTIEPKYQTIRALLQSNILERVPPYANGSPFLVRDAFYRLRPGAEWLIPGFTPITLP